MSENMCVAPKAPMGGVYNPQSCMYEVAEEQADRPTTDGDSFIKVAAFILTFASGSCTPDGHITPVEDAVDGGKSQPDSSNIDREPWGEVWEKSDLIQYPDVPPPKDLYILFEDTPFSIDVGTADIEISAEAMSEAWEAYISLNNPFAWDRSDCNATEEAVRNYEENYSYDIETTFYTYSLLAGCYADCYSWALSDQPDDWQGAIDVYKDYAETYPDSEYVDDAITMALDCYEDWGRAASEEKCTDGLRYFDEIINQSPSPDQALLLAIAECYKDTGDYANAIATYERLIALYPYSVCSNEIGPDPYEIPGESSLDLVDLYTMMGEELKALDIMSLRLSNCEDVIGIGNPEDFYELGMEYFQLNKCPNAKDSFADLLYYYPDDSFAIYAQAMIDHINENCEMIDEEYCHCE